MSTQPTTLLDRPQVSPEYLGFKKILTNSWFNLVDDEKWHLDSTIFRYVSSLTPLDWIIGGQGSRRSHFLSIHAVAYLAFIRLHEIKATMDRGAADRCVRAALYIAALPRQFSPDEIMELNPFALVSYPPYLILLPIPNFESDCQFLLLFPSPLPFPNSNQWYWILILNSNSNLN